MDVTKVISTFLLISPLVHGQYFPNRQHDGGSFKTQEEKTYFDQYKLFRMYTTGVQDQKGLYEFLLPRADFWTDPFTNGTVDFMTSPWEVDGVVRQLHRYRVPFKIIMEDVQHNIDAQMNDVASDLTTDDLAERSSTIRRAGNLFTSWFHFLMRPFSTHRNGYYGATGGRRPRKTGKFRKGHDMDWETYHRLSDIYDYMYFLQQKYPSLVEVMEIGKSVEKRPMLVMKIGSKKFADKPAIVIEGGIHAREWIAPATTTFIINQLVEHYRENQDLTDFYDFYILPVANPDGYEYSFTHNRLWRKNRRKNGGLSSLLLNLCDGVDLNRNFGYHWADTSSFSIHGGSSLSCAETYSGIAPFSEPESRNIADFVASIQQNVVSYIMIHSYGQKILYPWSYSKNRIHDWQDLQKMGQIMARSIEDVSGLNYAVGSSPTTQYLASGGSDDWARGEMGVKWVFLLELPDKGHHGFLLPAYHIRPTAKSIFQGIRTLAVRVSHTLAY